MQTDPTDDLPALSTILDRSNRSHNATLKSVQLGDQEHYSKSVLYANVNKNDNAANALLSESSNSLFSHSSIIPVEENRTDSEENEHEKRELRKLLFHGTAQYNEAVDMSDTDEHASRPSETDRRAFWFTDSHIGEIDNKFLALPSKKLAHDLAAWYFDNASPTYRILHRPLVYEWIDCGFHADSLSFDSDLSNESQVDRRSPAQERIRTRLLNDHTLSAVIFSMFAMGCLFPVGRHLNSPDQLALLRYHSEQYISIAQKELELDKGPEDMLIKLQALFLMCLYMLTTSRVKAAWDLLVKVKNIAVILNLNRQDPAFGTDRPKSWDRLGNELRKRCFWAAYTLETYMCTMLGKTMTWNEEDITVDLPALARYSVIKRVSETDGDAVADALSTIDYGGVSIGPSLMHTLIAHAKISRIIRAGWRKLYHHLSQNLTEGEQENIIDELAADVARWEEDLPSFLRLNSLSSSDGVKLPYARQIDVIHLAHAHALILIYRPSLNMFASSATVMSKRFPRSNDSAISPRRRSQQEKCLQAALSVADMGDFSILSGSNWYISYIVFCSITVMFVYLLHHPNIESRALILDRARKLCEVEMRFSAYSNNMAKRYVSALKELWRQVSDRLNEQQSSSQKRDTGGSKLNPPDPYTQSMSGVTNVSLQASLTTTSDEACDPPFSDPPLFSLDRWEDVLTPPNYLAQVPGISDIPGIRDVLQTAAAPQLSNNSNINGMQEFEALVGETTRRNAIGVTEKSEPEYDYTKFADILETLAQSFQGFDSVASVGFTQGTDFDTT